MKPALADNLTDEWYYQLSAGLELEDVSVFTASVCDPTDASPVSKALGAPAPSSQPDESKFSLARPGTGEELPRLHWRRFRHRSALESMIATKGTSADISGRPASLKAGFAFTQGSWAVVSVTRTRESRW
jgi:hypothetical protein